MARAVLVALHDVQAWKASTVNAHLSALRGVITEARELGYIDAEELKRATSIENLSMKRLPAGRHKEEVAATLNAGAGSNDEPGRLLVCDTPSSPGSGRPAAARPRRPPSRSRTTTGESAQ
jgi:hypothetical protein